MTFILRAEAVGQGRKGHKSPRPWFRRVLVQIDGTRRANLVSYYEKVVNVDAAHVQLLNDKGKQQTFESLPVGATIEFTVTGVNDAGKGQPNAVVG